MKAMLKFRNHLSVVAIRNECSNGDSFSFTQVEKKKKEKKKLSLILKLDLNKASQSSNVPINAVKESINIFSYFLCTSFSCSMTATKFPKNLKLSGIKPLHNKDKKGIKRNYSILRRLQVFFAIYQNYFKSES